MIIITGAAGFIGSAIVWALNKRQNQDLLLVDQLGLDEKWKNLPGLQYADYIEKDDFITQMIRGEYDQLPIDAIIHMGAISSTTHKDASELIRNNFNFTKELALVAINRDIPFIYASSAATYGDGAQGYSDNHDQLDTLRPLNAYGFSKHIFDLWAWRSGFLEHMVGLKFFNVYGPNENHKADMRSMVCKAYDQICQTGKVRLFKSDHPDYADGEQERDFIYIKDAVDMTLFFLDHPEATGIYNIGTGQANSWNTLIKPVFHAMGREPNIEYIPMPDHLKSKYQYHTQADTQKIQTAGYTKTPTPIQKAVQDYTTNYLIPNQHLADTK